MGSVVRTKILTISYVLAVFALAMVLTFVALMIREDDDGSLVHPSGPKWARFFGVTAYLSCAYLVLQLTTPGGS
jgi:hypothetical protein